MCQIKYKINLLLLFVSSFYVCPSGVNHSQLCHNTFVAIHLPHPHKSGLSDALHEVWELVDLN